MGFKVQTGIPGARRAVHGPGARRAVRGPGLPPRPVPDPGQVPFDTQSCSPLHLGASPPRVSSLPAAHGSPAPSLPVLGVPHNLLEVPFLPLPNFASFSLRMPPASPLLLVSTRSSWPGPFCADAPGDEPRISSTLQLLHGHSSQVAAASKKSSSL